MFIYTNNYQPYMRNPLGQYMLLVNNSKNSITLIGQPY